ncbi:hypothetical protein [Polaribacter porphyrae]|uniref:Uncharacterized protein n=1 Tax=Polaribacter porphyrae TaxID=1137780 RepID=A0A2S7WQJ9_9FLAO|nr:hypothetical protein [Polaribacter porphyrae]PQJ79854.1 hypothetical protein BTO18_12000 [Polaribacter porphyrae]
MELTKEQIQQIENRLKKSGLTYWDIRVEILDHLVSEIEAKIAKGESYNNAVENAYFKLNLNGNLESLNKRRLFVINKIVRKQYFTKILKLLTTLKSLFAIASFVFAYYLVFTNSNLQIFKIVTFTLISCPVILGVVLYLKEFYQKNSSGYLIYGSFYIFFAILLLNVVIQFIKPDGIIPVSKEIQLWIWFVVTCINSLSSFAGFLVYLNYSKRIKVIELNLKSL